MLTDDLPLSTSVTDHERFTLLICLRDISASLFSGCMSYFYAVCDVLHVLSEEIYVSRVLILIIRRTIE